MMDVFLLPRLGHKMLCTFPLFLSETVNGFIIIIFFYFHPNTLLSEKHKPCTLTAFLYRKTKPYNLD
jgi:hypothetical protein